jgi:GRASP55/65 PDZ-like domain
MWGGQGLLGVSIRFCSFEGANENVWHVLVSLALIHYYATSTLYIDNKELIYFHLGGTS